MVNLRKPSLADAASIAELSTELSYEVGITTMKHRLANLLNRTDYYLAVAEVSGDVAGWIQVHTYESLETGFRAEIVGLVVGATFRRRGIGRMLVEDAIEWSKAQGALVIVVRSNVIRKESHQFYPSVGFEVAKTQAVYKISIA